MPQTLALRDLLAFLEREDVSEVLLQTGSPPCVMLSGQVRPLSKTPLAEEAICGLLKGTGAAESAAKASSEEVLTAGIELEGRAYRVSSFIRKGRLQLRVVAVGASSPAVAVKNKSHDSPDRLSDLLISARKRRASDMHISSGRPAMIRAAGELLTVGDAIAHEQVEAVLLPLLNASRQEQLDSSGYTDLAADIEGAGRVRININRQRDGLKGCFRLVEPSPLPLEKLGLPPELESVTKYHQGLVVISGPNGSGKTTTAASLVDVFNASRPIHIITVEDPVEVLHPCKKAVVSQREVGAHTRSFAAALKGALREDPDVIAIGELRDLETVEMALSAAETGHLVIATMSTPSGARTIDRLIDMFPPGVQNQVRSTLAGTLKMVISQRLVPNADKTKRHAAAEMITGNIPLWAMIRDNKLYQLPSLLQRGRAYGMIRIDDSLNELVEQGLVTAETARLYADDPKSVGVKRDRTSEVSPHAPTAADAQKKQPGIGGLFGKRGK